MMNLAHHKNSILKEWRKNELFNKCPGIAWLVIWKNKRIYDSNIKYMNSNYC